MCLVFLFLMIRSRSAKPKTRVRNLTDRPVDIQIRVGSILMKAYTLKPGCCKTLRRRKIYSDYSTDHGGRGFFYDRSCEPYVWIHSPTHAAEYLMSPMPAKQQYISLDELREYVEMKICMDGDNGNFSVHKISTR